MRRSKRLAPVRKIKEREEKEAARRLGDAQKGLNSAIKQLEELQQYRQDYYTTLSGGAISSNVSVPATVLEKYQLFLAKLNGVVERQQETVEQYRQHVEAHRKAWVESHARLKSMDDLIARAREEEQLFIDKQEQKMIDERSQYPRREW